MATIVKCPTCTAEGCTEPAAWRRTRRQWDSESREYHTTTLLLCDEHQETLDYDGYRTDWNVEVLDNPYGRFAQLAGQLVDELRGAIFAAIPETESQPDFRLAKLVGLGHALNRILPHRHNWSADMCSYYAEKADKWLRERVDEEYVLTHSED